MDFKPEDPSAQPAIMYRFCDRYFELADRLTGSCVPLLGEPLQLYDQTIKAAGRKLVKLCCLKEARDEGVRSVKIEGRRKTGGHLAFDPAFVWKVSGVPVLVVKVTELFYTASSSKPGRDLCVYFRQNCKMLYEAKRNETVGGIYRSSHCNILGFRISH